MKDVVITTREEIEVLKKNTKEYWYKQGRADEQLRSIEDAKMQATEYLDALDIDMDKPMYFTNEQKAWIKDRIISNGLEAYERGAKDFAEWLMNKYEYAIEEVKEDFAKWQKEVENE